MNASELKIQAAEKRAMIHALAAEISERRHSGRMSQEEAFEAGKPLFDMMREVLALEAQARRGGTQ